MRTFDETLIDLALEIGYQMGENGETFAGDSRAAVELIYSKAEAFEKLLARGQRDYMAAVQPAAEGVYWELRLEGMLGL